MRILLLQLVIIIVVFVDYNSSEPTFPQWFDKKSILQWRAEGNSLIKLKTSHMMRSSLIKFKHSSEFMKVFYDQSVN